MNVTPMTSSPKGVSFMVHRLGTEVGPLKQVRELLINSFEAVQAYQQANSSESTFRGKVDVCADPYYLKNEHVRKAAFCDNGIGMDAHELRKYFNTLAESGKRQSIDENFGVGAKISTAAWNPYGVEIRSWKKGKGHLVRLVHDQRTDQYGLEQFEMEDGTFPDYLDLSQVESPSDYKSQIIEDHGTMVILLGKTLDHDTTSAPETQEVTHRDYWFQHVANKQFYRIPFGITLTSRLALVDGKPHTRTIEGYASVLDEFKTQSGMVQLSDANAHWWILDESRSVDLYRRRPYYHAFSGTKKQGHVVAIFRDELFDFTSHDEAIPLLQKFGIFAGYNHVAIYVEPTPALAVTANLTRTSLVLPDGTSLPWNRWASEFYEQMPDALAKYVEKHQSVTNKSEEEYVKDQIDRYKEFLQVKSARPNVRGEETGEADGNDGDAKQQTGSGKESGRPTTSSNNRRPAVHIKKGVGQMSISNLLLNFTPKWNWVSEEEASHLKSRAAHFEVERNFLEINQDFSVFRELIEHGLNLIEIEQHDVYRPRIEAIGKRIYLAQLVWTVMSAIASFRHREGWRGDGFDRLISPESLTAAVLPRVYLLNDMKRQVKSIPNIKKDLRKTPNDEETAA
ncbi:MAG: hypothetical protein ACYDC6_09640 [Acidobacteriaceae bacterium]